MQWDIPAGAVAPLNAPIFQLVVTLGAVTALLVLWRRFGKPHFAWWALAMAVYAVRLSAILAFLIREHPFWLFAHQVATGWTAVVFLLGALVFARTVTPPRSWVVAGLAFPVLWSWVAIYQLDHFLWAAGPAVGFLSLSSAWTAWVFFRHHRRVRSGPALFLSVTFLVWALHHLDYPFLRARGVWNPWGYYLDIVFILCTAGGILFLVQDDLRRGLATLAALAADLRERVAPDDSVQVLLERPLALPGVRATALFRADGNQGAVVERGGPGDVWESPSWGRVRAQADRAARDGRYVTLAGPPFITVLPLRGASAGDALLISSDVADPFTALDPAYLEALGRQVGAAVDSARLTRTLADRTEQLQRLAVRLTREHEDERQRLSRNLHDETAQVFAALNLELGALRETLDGRGDEAVDRALVLVSKGISSIRAVTDSLRPPLLDDLGALPALDALVADFASGGVLDVRAQLPTSLPPLTAEAELALYRALQEGLSNAARHSGARAVDVILALDGDAVALSVRDDGRGLGDGAPGARGGTGISGMRERVGALGGRLLLFEPAGGGTELRVELPVEPAP